MTNQQDGTERLAQGLANSIRCHGVVIPLYGVCPPDLGEQVSSYAKAGLVVVLVQNNSDDNTSLPSMLRVLVDSEPGVIYVHNSNLGGIAGGFNRGIERIIAEGVQWVTLLDQDSRLASSALIRLREPWADYSGQQIMVGPVIWDGRRHQIHGRRRQSSKKGYLQTRLLISSGTTFSAGDWPFLGPMMEWLVVDFVDHLWIFQSQARGFSLLQHPDVVLVQSFGQRHPHPLCHLLGMELYSPMRHYYSIRNLRFLLLNQDVPLDLRFKELLKMLFKPWLWLIFEPQKKKNLHAILMALSAPLPAHTKER